MVIMKNALWKDIFRDIKKSKGRFISIASIIALGVMLFAGVKIAPLDMKATADKYYDDYNLMDLRVVSTLGLTDEDVKDIKNIEGVLGVEPSKTLDVISKVDSDEFVIRVHSLPNNNLSDDFGTTYKISQRVKVKLIAVDLNNRNIDFVVVNTRPKR